MTVLRQPCVQDGCIEWLSHGLHGEHVDLLLIAAPHPHSTCSLSWHGLSECDDIHGQGVLVLHV